MFCNTNPKKIKKLIVLKTTLIAFPFSTKSCSIGSGGPIYCFLSSKTLTLKVLSSYN